jgi:GPH family glycoside/pentoside/hexuronide:cation symporter
VTTSPIPAASPSGKVPLRTIFAFGLPGMPIAGLLLILAVYLPRYYVGLGVSFAEVGLAIGVVRVLDVFVDPVLGLIMDRTKTPIGRYRPWMILGAPIVMVGVFRLLVSHGHVEATDLIIWLLVTYAGNSMLTLGIASWAAVLATGYNDRSRVYGLTQGMTVIGSVGLLLLPIFTRGAVVVGKAASMPTIGWILIIGLPVTVILASLFTPERIKPTVQPARFSPKDYWAGISRPSMVRIIIADLLLTLGAGSTGPMYVYFFHDAKGFGVRDVGLLLIAYIGAGLIGAPIWGMIARGLGKHRTVQIACVCYALAQGGLMAIPRVWPGYTFMQALPTIGGMFAVGLMVSAFIPIIRAMVADVNDEVRLVTGQDLTSLIYSMVTTTSKIGVAISVSIVFPILQLIGYNGKEGAVNTPQAIQGLEMCYLFAPIILVFIGGGALFGYDLDRKRHAEIRAALDAHEGRDEAAALESLTGPMPMSEGAG